MPTMDSQGQKSTLRVQIQIPEAQIRLPEAFAR